ncbi:MAG: ferritin-like domain-containing protein [Aquificaceae bacterium]
MDKKELISALIYDIALEHSAIIQYLYHIFLIPDPEVVSEIEEIARQEMRHLKWFGQKVVQLGGQVSLDRAEDMIMIGNSIKEMLQNNVYAEKKAIEVYSSHLELTKDDSVKKLLERVINDEKEHAEEFEKMLNSVQDSPSEAGPSEKPEIKLLNEFLKEEYQLIINYLYQFFHSKNWEYKDMVMDLAIESMVHMGKIGEAIGEMGAMPDLSRVDFSEKRSVNFTEQVKKDLSMESISGDKYSKELLQNHQQHVKKLLDFINKQEEYHRHRLMEFFKKMHKFTIGELNDR